MRTSQFGADRVATVQMVTQRLVDAGRDLAGVGRIIDLHRFERLNLIRIAGGGQRR